ncbi:MAG: HAMP domain-containing sensor histidine kinase [Planctomycetota bacterium]|nr:HAMP domain-containing sensor histidine kinase [Planctomycetota bacterium]
MGAIVFFTSLLAFASGALALAANTGRTVNQVFCLFATIFGASLCCIYGAIEAGTMFAKDGITDPIPWIRGNAIFGSFLPALLVLNRDAIRLPHLPRRELLLRCIPWFALGLILLFVALTNYFIPEDSTPYNRKRGPGYFAVSLTHAISYTFIVLQTWAQMRALKGIRRLELQFLAFLVASGLLLFSFLSFVGNWSGTYAYKAIALLVISATVFLTFLSICYYRIFDLRDVIFASIQRVLTLAIILLVATIVIELTRTRLPEPWSWLIAFVIVGLGAPWLDRRLRHMLGIGGERRLAKMRRTIIDCARSESQIAGLQIRFESFLLEECTASSAVLASELRDEFRGERFTLSKHRMAYEAIRNLGWATTETLQRRRSSPEIDDLRALLAEYSIGLLLAVPKGSPSPSLLVALGAKANEQPFTYPEVERLQNIAELMDNILTHSRLTSQAALQAKVEHLAMMSRGLAHDLKNLITPVSSFLIHTDGRYEPGSAEAEVHAAARRSVRVMTDYVRDALFFSERLQPKLELVDLPKLFGAVHELTASRAADHGVKVQSRIDVPEPVVADTVLLQRMLVNLVSNAIDASTSGQGVTLLADICDEGLRLQVRDEGCGVSAENLPRIFEPYFTTKQFGDDVRGFGLGLTICQKITNLHAGTITLQSELGKGTHVTVVLPSIPGPERLRPGPPCLALP